MSETSHTFAANLRSIRERLGLSTSELAGRMGVTRQYVYRLETGKVRVTLDHLHQISAALRVSPARLLRRAA